MAVQLSAKYACGICGFTSDDQADFKHGPGGAFCGPLTPVEPADPAGTMAELSEESVNEPEALRRAERSLRTRWRDRHGAPPRAGRFLYVRTGEGWVRVTLRATVSAPAS